MFSTAPRELQSQVQKIALWTLAHQPNSMAGRVKRSQIVNCIFKWIRYGKLTLTDLKSQSRAIGIAAMWYLL